MIDLIKNNYGHKVNINIKNADGTALNLSGYTATLRIHYPSASSKVYSLNTTDSTNGKVQFTVPEELTKGLGICKGYIDIESSSSCVTSDDIIEFNVKQV